MEIQGPGNVSGPPGVEPQRAPVEGGKQAGELGQRADRVEISERAQFLEKLSQVPSIRTERVEELRRLIESGEYESAERIARAIDKLLEEL